MQRSRGREPQVYVQAPGLCESPEEIQPSTEIGAGGRIRRAPSLESLSLSEGEGRMGTQSDSPTEFCKVPFKRASRGCRNLREVKAKLLQSACSGVGWRWGAARRRQEKRKTQRPGEWKNKWFKFLSLQEAQFLLK